MPRCLCLALFFFFPFFRPTYGISLRMSLSTTTSTDIRSNNLPVLSGDVARQVDLDVTEKVGRVRILESVATRVADTLYYHVSLDRDSPILFVAGKGNNGANAIACARILHLRGIRVELVTLVMGDEDNLRPNMQEQLELFDELVGNGKRRARDFEYIREWRGVIVDGILGSGIQDPPRGVSADAIRACNDSCGQVLAIDLPSGLNHVTGETPGDCIKATWTLNLHMFKSGQLEQKASRFIGELWSAETALGFTTFGDGLTPKFVEFYKNGPIRRVW